MITAASRAASTSETVAAMAGQHGFIESAAIQRVARSCNGGIPQWSRGACTIAALQNEQI